MTLPQGLVPADINQPGLNHLLLRQGRPQGLVPV